MDKVERNHIIKLIYSLVKLARELIGILVLFVFLIKKIGVEKAAIIAIVLSIAVIIIEFLEWWRRFFILRENSIYYQQGVLNLKKEEIPLDRINTIDISQGFLDRIFGTAIIKIDTGEAKEKSSELKFILSKKRAEEIKNIVLRDEVEEEGNKGNEYVIKSKELFIYSLISNSLFQGIGIILALQQVFDKYFKKFIKIDTDKYIKSFQNETFYYKLYIGIALLTTLVFLCICLSVVYNVFKYYKFKITADEKKLFISYGAISKKSYSFDRKKIKGIHIKQSLLMQWFGFFTMEIESIGYGDEQGEKAILYPICNEKLKNEFLRDLFPEFQYEGEIHKPPKIAYGGFFYRKLVLLAILTGILALIKLKLIILSGIALVFLLSLGHLQFKNSALGINKKLMYFSYNGFHKTQSIVKTSTVQSLTMSYHYFQQKNGLCNYKVILYSSSFGKTLKVRNIKNNVVQENF